jgi:hypothetical protein
MSSEAETIREKSERRGRIDHPEGARYQTPTWDEVNALLAENQRLREALERIEALKTWNGYSVEDLHAVAREALAGDAE